MKNHLYKAVLAAALGLAGATAAHAQNQAPSNDLLLGFTSPNATSDYIIDLGQLLGASAEQITLTAGQYSDSTFTSDLGSEITAGTTYAGIFGSKAGSAGDVITSSTSTPFGGVAQSHTILDAAASYPSSVALGSVAKTGQSVYNDISTAPGQSGNNANSFGEYEPEVLQTVSSSEGTGGSVLDLTVYEATYGLTTSTAFADKGYVSILFGSDGDIQGVAWDEAATAPVTSVPEPATFGIFGGIGMLLLGLRRQLTGKLA